MLCIYYKTVSRNWETGETTFLVTPKEVCQYTENGLLKCFGKIGIYTKGIPVEITGNYDSNKKLYIVSSDTLTIKTEENTFSILEYITGDLTEIQKNKIATLCNNDLFSFVLRKDAVELLADVFKGSKKAARVAKLIVRSVMKLKEEEDTTKELMSFGVPIDRIEVLNKKELTLDNLDKSPYLLMLKFGVPIDAIELYAAKRLNIQEYSIMRLCGFLYDAMIYSTKLGHTCCTLNYLTKIMNMRFKYHGSYATIVDTALVNLCVETLSDEVAYREINGTPFIYLHHIYEEETIALTHLRRLKSNVKNYVFPNYTINDVEQKLGITYNKEQREVFKALNTSGIKILTGPPGSGKTATLKGLMEYFTSNGCGVVRLAATTGMAAKVMSNACDKDAETANLMLDVRPFDTTVKGRDLNNPVEADLIIIDEVSMLGLQLFSVLMRAVSNGSILILVGDENQLQSVDYGNVLHDLISSDAVEVYRLTEILRQSGTICDNAQKINKGLHNLVTDNTFIIHKYNDPQDIINELQKHFVKDKSQILSPIKNGILSTFELNCLFQDTTASFAAAYGKKVFRIGDKIIMTKTNYEKGYINGDIGHIIGVNDDESVIVKFDTENLTIERQDMRDMELADAVTIHKSQGSEFDDVHIILPEAAKHMMTRRILYTATTRAKKMVHIYVIGDALKDAINDNAERKRITMLGIRLKELENLGK